MDTAMGVCHLRAFVESLTDKPLTVVLSHGHVDHAPGAVEFDEVYMNQADLPVYRDHCRLEERQGYLKANLRAAYAELTPEDFDPSEPDKTSLPLADGTVFDLGGVHVRTIAFPGHTPGSMVFLVEEARLLILGDACNNSTFLFDNWSGTVESYRSTVKAVRDRLQGRLDRVFLCHHDLEAQPDILDHMLDVCDDVMAGRADDLPYHFRGMEAYIAKQCSKHFERADGKSGNLIYSKAKIFDRQLQG